MQPAGPNAQGASGDTPEHYDLPERLIASRPAARRDGSRMMVVDRASGRVTHGSFRDFPGYLRDGDLAVLNDSKVIRARLIEEGGRAEVFLLEEVGAGRWKCMVRPGRKFRAGATGSLCGSAYRVLEVCEDGLRVLEFDRVPDLDRVGQVPLPPYIRREADESDVERYQTVYAREPGSVAAPTAGLHFTGEILERVPHAFVTLHVGAGTFLPVKTDSFAEHVMHEERYAVTAGTAEAVNSARRVVAVGTTVVRVLESLPEGPLEACSGRTAIFIRTPFAFRRTGALLTNFHLPRSTLLALVCAFAGRELVLEAYREAVREEYRFYSYGDCMLVV